jgi:hypothetical protein
VVKTTPIFFAARRDSVLPIPPTTFLGLLVKIAHKIGAVFVYWSKLVN